MGYGQLGVDQRDQRLVLHHDGCQRTIGRRLVDGGHHGDRLTRVMDGLGREDRLILDDQPEQRAAGNVSGAKNGRDPGEPAGCCEVEASDAGRCVGASQSAPDEHPGHGQIAGVREDAGGFGGAVSAGDARVERGHSAGPTLLLGQLNGGKNAAVAGAAAQISGERQAGLLIGRIRVTLEQRRDGDDEAG